MYLFSTSRKFHKFFGSILNISDRLHFHIHLHQVSGQSRFSWQFVSPHQIICIPFSDILFSAASQWLSIVGNLGTLCSCIFSSYLLCQTCIPIYCKYINFHHLLCPTCHIKRDIYHFSSTSSSRVSYKA